MQVAYFTYSMSVLGFVGGESGEPSVKGDDRLDLGLAFCVENVCILYVHKMRFVNT